jgi:Domain of unknown function (DUF4326)
MSAAIALLPVPGIYRKVFSFATERNMITTRTPQRIHLRRTKGWRKPDGAIVVARPTKWGNPYPVAEYGRDEAIRRYREWLSESGNERKLAELAGRDLACWCPLDLPCHADVLLDLANRVPTG